MGPEWLLVLLKAERQASLKTTPYLNLQNRYSGFLLD